MRVPPYPTLSDPVRDRMYVVRSLEPVRMPFFLSDDQVGTAMAGLDFRPMRLSYPSPDSSN